MKMVLDFLNWAWSLLPDRCEVEGCSRRGVRGNENYIGGRLMCDYCHAARIQPVHTQVPSDE